MGRIILLVLLILLPVRVWADTHNVTCSGSITSTLQAAISAASNGDIVEVSSGTCSASSISIPNTKGITLKGAGIGVTNLSVGSISFQTALGNSPARITGFTFTWSSGHFLTVNNSNIGANNWRIDHIYFNYTGSEFATAAIYVQGWTFGVIDNCIFNAAARGVFIEAEVAVYGTYKGDYSWVQPLDLGGPTAVYVESCTFQGMRQQTDQAIESRFGARYVFRYNTVYNFEVDSHSGCANQGRNPVSAEIYHNTFSTVSGPTNSRAIYLRSTGTTIAFSNTITGNYAAGIHYAQEESCLTCGGAYSAAPYTSYYSNDQMGRKLTDQSLSPWYEWANTKDAAATHFVLNPALTCEAMATMVQENRDFYAASTGTSAPTGACTPRAGYFATGVGQHGTLYQCTATNVWTAYYTPYTYPHPIRNQSLLFKSSPSLPGGPPAPTGLKVVK
jgi:hypothetical protein